MTPPDRIAEIRARWNDGSVVRGDVHALFAALDERDREIERLREEVAAQAQLASAWQGNAAIGRERIAELERTCIQLRAESIDACLERDAAYRAGAEAMREACAIEAEQHDAEAEPFIKGGVLRILARDIRALPLPEPKR